MLKDFDREVGETEWKYVMIRRNSWLAELLGNVPLHLTGHRGRKSGRERVRSGREICDIIAAKSAMLRLLCDISPNLEVLRTYCRPIEDRWLKPSVRPSETSASRSLLAFLSASIC